VKAGTRFSLKITHTGSRRSIQVDSAVTVSRRFAAAENWGIRTGFTDCNERKRSGHTPMVSRATAAPTSARTSRYLTTPIGETILRYVNLTRLVS
jgi:hypothetical protein